jgi:hypothetical protein
MYRQEREMSQHPLEPTNPKITRESPYQGPQETTAVLRDVQRNLTSSCKNGCAILTHRASMYAHHALRKKEEQLGPGASVRHRLHPPATASASNTGRQREESKRDDR